MKAMLKNSWLLVILILIIATFLRFYEITKLPPGFYPDEAINANNGIEAWETGHFKVFYPENYGREGLWSNIIGFFVVRFGHEPWIPRAVAAVFGIFTVLGIYFLTKELFSKKNGLLASFFIATSFWHINFSRIAFRAVLAPFFLVWAVYFLLLSLRQIKKQKSPKFYILNSIFSGIFYGLGFHTYIAYRVTPLLILIILLFYWQKVKVGGWQKSFMLQVSCFMISAFIVALPLGSYFLQNPQDFFGRTNQISIFSSSSPIKALVINILKTTGMFNFSGDQNWRHNYSGRPELFWPVGILFLLGIFWGIKTISKQPREWEYAILFGWLIVAAMPVILSNESLPHALRALLMAPPVFILAGIGGVWLIGNIKNQISKIKNTNQKSKIFNFLIHASLFIILSLFIFEAYTVYFIKWGQNPNTAAAFNENYVAIGRQLNALSKELPKYVVVKAPGVEVRGIPMPAQTVMFITDTFTPEKQKQKNIFYLLPEQTNQIPEKNSYTVVLE